MFAEGVLSDPEAASLLSLVASCSLEDVEAIQGRRKGKDRGGPLTDEELALQLFAEEARALQILAQDIALARSIDNALRADATILDQYEQIEQVERHDREVARALAEGRPPPTRRPTPAPTPIPGIRPVSVTTTVTAAATPYFNRSCVP